jgi:pyocin large subunit-like protein
LPHTKGFAPGKLGIYFHKHGAAVGAATRADYEQEADEFIAGALKHGTLACQRSTGDRVRYNVLTDEFAVVTPAGFIRTYYLRRNGLNYFVRECRK